MAKRKRGNRARNVTAKDIIHMVVTPALYANTTEIVFTRAWRPGTIGRAATITIGDLQPTELSVLGEQIRKALERIRDGVQTDLDLVTGKLK